VGGRVAVEVSAFIIHLVLGTIKSHRLALQHLTMFDIGTHHTRTQAFRHPRYYTRILPILLLFLSYYYTEHGSLIKVLSKSL